jgi:hypothetical protein
MAQQQQPTSVAADTEKLCTSFFEEYASELPPPMDGELRAIASALFANHMRSRLGSLFSVAPGDAETSIGEATSLQKARGWRLAIEDRAGMTFSGGNVPASASLVKAITGRAPEHAKKSKSEKRRDAGESTVSDDMMATGAIPNSPIAEACFDAFTNDTTKHTAKNEEVMDFVDNVVSQFFTSHGKTNLGAGLLRNCARQAHARVKFLPARGRTAGCDRRFMSMLYDKTNNRTHVRHRGPHTDQPTLTAVRRSARH